jgi:single-stranded-DNA-specific exonuclease
MGKGSGRSVPGLNLVEALSYCSSLLEKYGGHELAAGLTVREEKLAAFRDRINEYATTRLGTSEPQVSLDIDCELYPSEIGIALASELELLEPCGVDNPVPTFASFGLEIAEMIPMGQGKHTKFILSGEGKRFAAVMFGTAPESTGFVQGDCVDIAYRLGINEYMGNRSEQVLIRDVRLNRDGRDEGERLYGEYAACLEGECPVRAEWIPVRADFISVYLHLKRTLPSEGGRVGVRELLHSLSGICQGENPINYVKLRLILDILKESGIITLDPADVTARGRESFEITVPKVETKVDFGDPAIETRTFSVSELVITGGSSTPLDGEFAINYDDVKVALEQRKARLDELKNKAATKGTSGKAPAPASGNKFKDLGF